MAYVDPNFKTKKALKQAVTEGKHVSVYQPGIGDVPRDGSICVEGPHYPESHRWYAQVILENGKVVKVR